MWLPLHQDSEPGRAAQAVEALERLRGGGRHRARLGALRRLAPHGPGSAPVPLLAQLAARVAERAPAPDLVHNTASLRCAPGRTRSSPSPSPCLPLGARRLAVHHAPALALGAARADA
jgi:hypothetical protein